MPDVHGSVIKLVAGWKWRRWQRNRELVAFPERFQRIANRIIYVLAGGSSQAEVEGMPELPTWISVNSIENGSVHVTEDLIHPNLTAIKLFKVKLSAPRPRRGFHIPGHSVVAVLESLVGGQFPKLNRTVNSAYSHRKASFPTTEVSCE